MTNWPEDYQLEYDFTNNSGNFINAKPKPPSFGIALQLEQCGVEVPDMFLMVQDPNDASEILLKLSNGSWSLVATGLPLLPYSSGGSNIMLGSAGIARKFGNSFWVSGQANSWIAAWRSDNLGVTWALKPEYPDFADTPHGLAVCRDAAGNVWWAEREASDIFVIKKSTDNGDTGSISYTAPTDEDSIYHGACHLIDADVIAFAGIKQDGGSSPTVIWVTTNGGSSWTRNELNPAHGALTDSMTLLFTGTGDLLYATIDQSGSTEILRVYRASSPYNSFSEDDLITENVVSIWEGPFMASSPNPQFLAMNWETGGDIHSRIWRRTIGAWEELAEPFAIDNRIYGVCYNGTTLYAIADNGVNEILIAKAENAESGSVTWVDVTSEVNAVAGVTSVLLGPLIWNNE